MSNFYTIDPNDWEEPSFTPDFSKVKNTDATNLKVAADGEIYLSDNAPDFLFDEWDRKRRELIGIDIAIPSTSSHSNSKSHDQSTTKEKDDIDDAGDNKKKESRRIHRSSLMQVHASGSSRRLTRTTGAEVLEGGKAQGGRGDGLVKSESKRMLTRSSSQRKNLAKWERGNDKGLLDDNESERDQGEDGGKSHGGRGDGLVRSESKRMITRSSSLRKNLPNWEKGSDKSLLDDNESERSDYKKRGVDRSSSLRKHLPNWEKSDSSLLDLDTSRSSGRRNVGLVKSESKRGLTKSSSVRKNLPNWESGSDEDLLDDIDNKLLLRKSESKRGLTKTSGSFRKSLTKTEPPPESLLDNDKPSRKAKGSDSKETSVADTFFRIIDLNPSKYRQKIDEDLFVECIEKYPYLCSQKYEFSGFDNERLYPLHVICAMGASLHTVKVCYKIYAEAIDYVSSEKGMTCLHFAAWYTRAPLDVIQFLVKKEPDAVQAVTKKQRTPLHLACMCPPSFKSYNPQVVMILTEIGGPGLCLQVDKHGRTPLHVACGIDEPSLEIVEDLTDVNPDACLVQCFDYQSTPLHLACSNPNVQDEDSKIVDVIKDLIRSNPDAVRLKDKDGQLPIFVAVTNRACLKVLKMLVRKYSDCLEVMWNGITLHELAKKLKLDAETVSFLDPYEDDD